MTPAQTLARRFGLTPAPAVETPLAYQPPSAPSQPTIFEAVMAVSTETGCTVEMAEEFVTLLAEARDTPEDAYRGRPRGMLVLTDGPQLRRLHPVMDGIMRDEAESKPGTAHDICERALGAKFRHTRFEQYCSIDSHRIQAVPA